MATGAKVNKTAKRSTIKGGQKDDRAAAIQAASTGDTNIMYPIKDAVGAYVRHPLNGKTPNFRTDGAEFAAMLKELSELGLGGRLQRELGEFRDKYDARWGDILNKLQADNVFGDRPVENSDEATDTAN